MVLSLNCFLSGKYRFKVNRKMKRLFNLNKTNRMKNFQAIFLLIAVAMFLSACSSTQQASRTSYDDVYVTSVPKQPAPEVKQPTAQPSDYTPAKPAEQPSRFEYTEKETSSSSTRTDKEGNTYITNNYYYDPDDYYDYAYTARLRRFYRPYYGWGYFDSYYTNLYWYDYDPASWGVSIYMGYNWWPPAYYYYHPFAWSFRISFGWPVYNCWGQPYWYWYHPYWPYYYSPYLSGYYHGYYHGYWTGYYHGLYHNPYYYNSYDYNSYNNYFYYGPRRSALGGKSSSVPRASVAALYQRTVEKDQPRTPVISTVSSAPAPSQGVTTPPERPTIRPIKNVVAEPAATENGPTVKPSGNTVKPDPRPAGQPAEESTPVRPIKKDTPTKPEQYSPAPSIQNPPVRNPEPRPRENPADNYTPSVKPEKERDRNSLPQRPREESQWDMQPISPPHQWQALPQPDIPVNEVKPQPSPDHRGNAVKERSKPYMRPAPQQNEPSNYSLPSKRHSRESYPQRQQEPANNSSRENKRSNR
jgi:hypothetical protein